MNDKIRAHMALVEDLALTVWSNREFSRTSPEYTAVEASAIALQTEQAEPKFDDALWGLFNEHNVPMKTRDLILAYFAATPSEPPKRLSDEEIALLQRKHLHVSEVDGYSIHGAKNFARDIEAEVLRRAAK